MYIKIRSLNCEIVHCSDSRPSADVFNPEVLENLAEMEHRRWMAERFVNNWNYGPEKNIGLKISPYLVRWDQLLEEIKDYDRNFVRMIPDLIKSVGKKIVKQHVH